MTIWWCEEHKVSGGDARCAYAAYLDADDSTAPCRTVEMRLIPVDPGKKVWWCEEHDLLAGVEFGGYRHCHVSQLAMQADTVDCRVVEMNLVPVLTDVTEKSLKP